MAKKGYYAVKVGRQRGVFQSWDECKAAVQGHSNAVYKKFDSLSAADLFINAPIGASESLTQFYQRFTGKGSSLRPSRDKSPDSASSNGPTSRSADTYRISKHTNSYRDTRSSNSRSSGIRSGDVRVKDTKISSSSSASALKFPLKLIYTDGACRNNGKENAAAGYGVYFGPNDPRNLSRPLSGPRQTNQRAELQAIDSALSQIQTEMTGNKPVQNYKIYTDSQYLKNCYTNWSVSWQKNNWISSGTGKPVENRDIIEPALVKMSIINDLRVKNGLNPIELEYVKAHNGDPGNEMADKLANGGVDQKLLRY